MTTSNGPQIHTRQGGLLKFLEIGAIVLAVGGVFQLGFALADAIGLFEAPEVVGFQLGERFIGYAADESGASIPERMEGGFRFLWMGDAAPNAPALVRLAFEGGMMAAVATLIAGVLRSARRGAVFVRAVADRVTWIGWLLVTAPFAMAALTVGTHLITKQSGHDGVFLEFSQVWGALLVLALGAVFREGARLKEQEELTI